MCVSGEGTLLDGIVIGTILCDLFAGAPFKKQGTGQQRRSKCQLLLF